MGPDLEALRLRYEAGDTEAVIEALARLGPVWRFVSDADPSAEGAWGEPMGPNPTSPWGPPAPDLRPYYPPMPPWLEIAVRDSLADAARGGKDSLRRAFGVPVASGCKTTQEVLLGHVRENQALGLLRGFQAARRDTCLRYPRGEGACDIVAGLMEVSGETVKRLCKAARARGAMETHGNAIEAHARRSYRWVLTTTSYPPWPPEITDIWTWDEALRRGLLNQVNQKRFW